ncbi:Fibronectin, type III [Candidatus Koribacter versatilis Ellin345]|uniref:Fibronectin, type III n=1 Tax=Koribacter versatilis (strain Ellin345) TaxID=204669 RepID=Q1IQE1_KORVE|nr:hypothetical protein [Candidatus Koribacter versatilis]ABF40909.1 Fibronectin, type III [Candidatus Koribacter versatilis Ellin345]
MRRHHAVVFILLLTLVSSLAAVTSGTPATITSPTPGTKLSSTSATFQWTTGTNVTSYSLYVGTTRGAHDIYFINTGTGLSASVNNLPANGGTFYVVLNSLIGAAWQQVSYTYIAMGSGTAASITGPILGAKLTTGTQLFQWSGGAGISQYSLYIGNTRGAHDIAFINAGTSSSYDVTGLPTDGRTFYVTLYSLNGSTWLAKSYSYVASGNGVAAAMTSPATGAKLASGTQLFQWSGGVGISQYSLYIGTVRGGHDIAFVNAGIASSYNVTGLPTNGETFYVTLYSLNGNTWLAKSYTYYSSGAGTAAYITSPSPGSQFSGTSATFSWMGGAGISQYSLYVGTTAGAHDIAFVNAGLSTSANVTGLPNGGQTIYVTLSSLNGNTWLSNKYTYQASGITLQFNTSTKDIASGLINYAYATYFDVSGGSHPYTFAIASGSAPTGVVFSGTAPGMLAGTPTASGNFTFTVKVTDSNNNSITSPSFTIPISAGPNGAHNSYVNGRYICTYEGYVDSDTSRIATLMSLAIDGAGHVTSGVYDSNGRSTGLLNGSVSGSYNLGGDNNGTITLSIGSKTLKFGMMGNNVGGSSVSQFDIAQIDDVGSAAPGQHGGGVCSKATTSAFSNTTMDGKSFAFTQHGENGNGIPRALAGRFTLTASGSNLTITGGQADQADGSSTLRAILFGGSYTEPGSTGRFTITVNQTSPTTDTSYAVGYVIDANHMAFLNADSGKAQVGEMYKQQQASYSAANLNSSFVMRDLEWALDGSGGLQWNRAQIMQGTGAGGSGSTASITINQSFTNDADSTGSEYKVGDSNGTATFTVSSNGRMAMNDANQVTVAYLYDNNSAFGVSGGQNVGSGLYGVAFNYIEPQMATTPGSGSYLSTVVPRIEPEGNINVDLVTLGSGTIAGIGDGGAAGGMDYASPFSGTFTTSSYGAFYISSGGEQVTSCFVVSSTRVVCIDDTTRNPSVSVSVK